MNKRFEKTVALVLPVILIAGIIGNAYGSEGMEHESGDVLVDFTAQIEFIKGHLMQAMTNKEMRNIELTIAHSGHPAAEHFAAVSPELMDASEQLHEELQSSLEELPGKADQLSTADFRAEVERIISLLDDAIDSVVPDDVQRDGTFWMKVMIQLLETAEHEYEEAVADGQIEELVEYQDAQAFVSRAEALFMMVADQIDEHEREEIEIFFMDAKESMDSLDDPEHVETFIGGIIHELREVAGIATETVQKGYVPTIKQLLDQIMEEYEEGEYAEAERLAVRAYLDNYEFIEADIEAVDPELMETTEIMLREELRDLIRNRAPMEQIEQKISEININLDRIADLGIGLAEEVEGDPRLVYVDNIRQMLDKVVEEYEEGEYEEAMSFAMRAYLDNYEFLEHDVDLADEELNEEIEHMLRDELRDKINNRAPVSEIRELVSEIDTRMDAVAVIVPEFPVGLMIAMASIVGTMVAMTRVKRIGLGLP